MCTRLLRPLKVRHGRVCLHADAVRIMANKLGLRYVHIPAYFGSTACHTWQDNTESVAIVYAWCNNWGPHACMQKKNFRNGSNFCAGSSSPYKGCEC